jgi:hypothetical protein
MRKDGSERGRRSRLRSGEFILLKEFMCFGFGGLIGFAVGWSFSVSLF